MSYLFCSHKFHKNEKYCRGQNPGAVRKEIRDLMKTTIQTCSRIYLSVHLLLSSNKVILLYLHVYYCELLQYFIFEVLKKKIWANFQRIIEVLPKKLSLRSQKYGFGIRDPGSEIRDLEKTYSESRIQESKRHRIPDPIRIRNTGSTHPSSWHLFKNSADQSGHTGLT